MRKLLSALFVTLVMAAPAAAQDYKPVDIHFGFGWAFPTTDFKNSFNTGWNGAIGATFNINEHLGVMGEYMYTRMDGPDKTISVVSNPGLADVTNGLIQSNHQMHVGDFNLVYRSQLQDRPLGWYVLGGGGIYHRIVQLTSPSVGYTTVCDPYWYYCYPGLVAVDTIIGDRSSNDFGIDMGGGITFGNEVKFFVESRYHYVWGPEVTPQVNPLGATGSTGCESGCTTNAAYFPLTFGFKW
jgi:hypothetical protein